MKKDFFVQVVKGKKVRYFADEKSRDLGTVVGHSGIHPFIPGFLSIEQQSNITGCDRKISLCSI